MEDKKKLSVLQASNKRRTESKVIVLNRSLLNSTSYADLSGNDAKVLIQFMCKRQVQISPAAGKRLKRIVIVNNGQITYSYDEAESQGYSRGTFAKIIDSLVDHGFIDIAESGAGLFRSSTLYALSDRWQLWGTPVFVKSPRKKRIGQIGFKRGHPSYKKK